MFLPCRIEPKTRLRPEVGTGDTRHGRGGIDTRNGGFEIVIVGECFIDEMIEMLMDENHGMKRGEAHDLVWEWVQKAEL